MRHHYDSSIINFTISFHLNNFPQPICINDFQIIRKEVILELCLQTMEDASVEVNPVRKLGRGFKPRRKRRGFLSNGVKPNTFLAKAWKFPTLIRNFSFLLIDCFVPRNFASLRLFFSSLVFLLMELFFLREKFGRKGWAEEKRLKSMMFMKLTWEENYVICSISLSIQHHTPRRSATPTTLDIPT
jgi:hypothetical protein